MSSSDTSSSSSEGSYLNFESSDDELELLEVPLRIRPKNEEYFEFTIPEYSDSEFIEHFRMKGELTEELANKFKLSEYFNYQAGGNGKLNDKQHILIFLWFAGHQTASFRDVADRFNITISTLYAVIQRVVYFLSNLSAEIIQWPSEVEKIEIEGHFCREGFPGVLGAIDGTHIRIDKPKNDPDSYLNRKHYFSMQMQVVCDHKKKIRDIFVGYPGSVHDSRVFRTSPLYTTLAEKCGNYYILRDSGYPCQRNLLTPYKDRGQLTARQLNFNIKLSSNRYIVEHCFGLLKQRFRQLYHIKMKDISLIANFVRACCVLHNFIVDDEITLTDANIPLQILENVDNVQDEDDHVDGTERRNFVANHVLNVP